MVVAAGSVILVAASAVSDAFGGLWKRLETVSAFDAANELKLGSRVVMTGLAVTVVDSTVAFPEYGGGGMNGDVGPFVDWDGVDAVAAAVTVFVAVGVKNFGTLSVATG
mmetsp:Transcript_26334/g.61876  ORF Transcript_26334/g.61876 Transcript_26334/m.61876 type:complete len:109 (-) Transcript_26334:556-882(-)